MYQMETANSKLRRAPFNLIDSNQEKALLAKELILKQKDLRRSVQKTQNLKVYLQTKKDALIENFIKNEFKSHLRKNPLKLKREN
jgi:hypothetical protein